MKTKVQEKLEQLREIIEDSSIRLTSELQDAQVSCNESLLEILLNNLLSNAVRHNIKQGSIHILLRPGVFTISNTGSTVPLNKEKIFLRFYKDEQHTTRHGLGLAIVKEIAVQSGMRIAYDRAGDLHLFRLEWDTPPVV